MIVLFALKGKLKNAGPATVTVSFAASELFVTARYAKPRRLGGMVTVKLLSSGTKVAGTPLRNAANSPVEFVVFDCCPATERVTLPPGWAFRGDTVSCGLAWKGRVLLVVLLVVLLNVVMLVGHWVMNGERRVKV